MRKTLLATAALLAWTVSSHAAVIQDFGLDPTSAGGAFNHSLGTSTSAFDDQYLFQLNHTMTLTIASVTNVFAQGSDLITNFTGSVVYEGADGVIGGGDDQVVIGPVMATQPCGFVSNCQGFAGSAILGAGHYYLDIAGTANGTSGYGGNLATFATDTTPLPGAIWLFGSALAAFGLVTHGKKKPKSAWDISPRAA
jgi:hypothetical protein